MSVRSLPYLIPGENRVKADPWFLTADGHVELPASIKGWDYHTTLDLERHVAVDRDGILSDTGLPSTARLRLCVRVRPSTSLIRTCPVRLDLRTNGTVVVRAEVAGDQLAGRISIETIVELSGEEVDSRAGFSPWRAGSILWRDEFVTALEGESNLLPIAPVSFAKAGLPSSAAWYVSLDAERWDWAAMGSVMVLLNSDNAAVEAALRHPDRPESIQLIESLEVDFVADLVGRAVSDQSFSELFGCDNYAADADLSVGALVRSLVRTRLCAPTETVEDALTRLRDLVARDPSMWRASVQAGLGYPKSGGK